MKNETIIKGIIISVFAFIALYIVAFAVIAPKVINELGDIYNIGKMILIEKIEKEGEQ